MAAARMLGVSAVLVMIMGIQYSSSESKWVKIIRLRSRYKPGQGTKSAPWSHVMMRLVLDIPHHSPRFRQDYFVCQVFRTAVLQ